jgi:hypothetical protein
MATVITTTTNAPTPEPGLTRRELTTIADGRGEIVANATASLAALKRRANWA